MFAAVNGWCSAQKATYRAVSLQGPALTVLTNISADHHGDYDVLVAGGLGVHTELN